MIKIKITIGKRQGLARVIVNELFITGLKSRIFGYISKGERVPVIKIKVELLHHFNGKILNPILNFTWKQFEQSYQSYYRPSTNKIPIIYPKLKYMDFCRLNKKFMSKLT